MFSIFMCIMIIEYKGYKAEVGFKNSEGIFIENGLIGYVYLTSDVIRCRSLEASFYESEIEVLKNMYIKYFKNKVDGK